jgi:hypothetical protein
MSMKLKLLGIVSVSVAFAVPAWAGERTREEATLKTRQQVEVRDGKMFKRTVRSVRKNVEVDIQVPVERTRQDPITRYVPVANPLTYRGVPAAGTSTSGDTRSEVTLSQAREDSQRRTLVTVTTRTWREVLEDVLIFSTASWQNGWSVGSYKVNWTAWGDSNTGFNYRSRTRAIMHATIDAMSDADRNRTLGGSQSMVFTRSGQYVGTLNQSWWGNLETHYGEGGQVTVNGKTHTIIASFLYSPLALDLNHDGRINVTGKATGAARYNPDAGFTQEGSVTFDLRGLGKPGRYEWLQATGDGLLVDDRDGRVSRIAQGDGKITGLDLFGGHFDGNGFIKAARLFEKRTQVASLAFPSFKPRSGHVLSGQNLEHLKVWIDANHDALVTPDELRTCDNLGITAIDLGYHLVGDAAETRMVSTFTQNGEKHLLEDVWFAEGPTP